MLQKFSMADFIANGFNECEPNFHSTAKSVCTKTVYVAGRRAFTIVVEYFVWERHEGWNADAQFNMNSDQPTFNVVLLDVESPQQVVDFFLGIWTKMECDHYG